MLQISDPWLVSGMLDKRNYPHALDKPTSFPYNFYQGFDQARIACLLTRCLLVGGAGRTGGVACCRAGDQQPAHAQPAHMQNQRPAVAPGAPRLCTRPVTRQLAVRGPPDTFTFCRCFACVHQL